MTTDMQARDEKEFEAWRESLSLLHWSEGRNTAKEAWRASLAAERARSKCLVSACERIAEKERSRGAQRQIADEALKAYRGEVEKCTHRFDKSKCTICKE